MTKKRRDRGVDLEWAVSVHAMASHLGPEHSLAVLDE